MSTVAGPGGGAAFVGASVAPPPISPPPESAPAALAALPSPDRELILSSVVAGVSIPNTVAALGVTPAAVRLAQQALTELQPAETANGPPPATRERVVLLPHAWTEPAGTRPDNHRRAGRAKGMNQDNSPRQPPPRGDDTARAIGANMQWHDAELAMKVARHSYESWLVAGHKDTPSTAIMHAYHTHTALHEAARAISVLIETFRVEATMQATTPVPGNGVPTQRR